MRALKTLIARVTKRPLRAGIAAGTIAILVAATVVAINHSRHPTEAVGPTPSPSTSSPVAPSIAPTPDTSRCKRPGRIDGTGRTDVTAAVQRFLSSVPDGACAVFPTLARYRIDGAIVLTDRHRFSIYGYGVTFLTSVKGRIDSSAKGAGRSQRAMFQFVRGSDIRVQGPSIDGPDSKGQFDAPYEEEAGIRLSGVTRAAVVDVSVTHSYGDAVSVYGYKANGVSTPSRNVLIERLHAHLIGRQGVSMTGADGVTIRDSDLDDIARSVFDLEPLPRQSVVNVRITGNRVGTYGNTFVGGGGDGPKISVYVGHNTVSVPIRIKFFDGTHFTIEDNVGGGIAKNPLVTGSGDDLRVVGNVQMFNGPGQACPPNCGASALELTTNQGSICHAFAASNTFDAAHDLFLGTVPASPCSWVDGGHNVVGGPAPNSSSSKS